jgi:hypothetical protein
MEKKFWSILTLKGGPLPKKIENFFHLNMTIYTPNESSHLADAKYAVFKNISSDFNQFCDEKQKRVQRVQFWSTKSTPFICTRRVYSFTLFCTRKIWSPCVH